MTMGERRRVRREKTDWSFLAINAGFVFALTAVAAVAAWPIYASSAFVVLVVVASVLGAAIAVVGLIRGFSWLTVALITIGVYLVVGVPLAIPSALSGGSLATGWLGLVTSSVFGWKELVTISIPVGSYQNLLVPALVVFLVGPVTALSLAWRSRRVYFLALPVLFLMLLFGIAFGSGSASDATSVLGVGVTAPREFALGLVAFLLGFAFLLWRVQYARRNALRSAQVSAGISQSRPGIASLLRRLALAAVIVLIALAGSAAVTPALGATQAREVLRTNVDPDVKLREFVSPLTQYRSYFEGERYDSELLTVTSDAPLDTRLRLAVLSYYDGQVFRVINPDATDSSQSSAFVRVPYRLSPEVDGATEQKVTVAVSGYSGVWVPTVGSLVQASFDGSNSSQLADNFFYNPDTASAVELDSLSEGDTYTLDAVVPPRDDDLLSIGAPLNDEGAGGEVYPKSLVDWVKAQQVEASPEGLATLISRLRARGYLSHSIGTATDAANAQWIGDLGSTYTFKQSLAGHSTDRIGVLFQALLDKQNSTNNTADFQLVSGVGDNEQFSAAAALLAQYLGYSSRIVIGFELGAAPAAPSAILPCADGVCRGKNLSAWIEVQGSNGGWHSADVTPQVKNALDPVNTNRRDPENGTDVARDNVNEQLPPDATPSGGDGNNQANTDADVDLTWLVTTLKIVGFSLLGLLVLLAPFITILVAKARRRADRRTSALPEASIVGGWDEYVDTALDHGRPAPTSETRAEIAAGYATPAGTVLAEIADRAVFGAIDPHQAESDTFWRIVDEERRHFSDGMTRWQRWRAAVSLKSFTRYVNTSIITRRK